MLDYRVHTFLEVCRHHSFTQAAEALHITQPAVSQHIRQLESAYGCTLFRKEGRSITPTAAGEVLFARLSVAENDERRIRDEVRAAAEMRPGNDTLRFGCTRTIGDFVAPGLIARFAAQHPETHVVMISGNTFALVEKIEQGEIDFALVEGSFDRREFDFEVLSRERYIAVGPVGCLPHGHRPSSLEHLLEHRLVLREAGSGTREIIEKHLLANDLSIASFSGYLELGTIAAIKACVQAGTGITFIYRSAVERELAEGSLVDITPRSLQIEHDFCLIWQRGSQYADRFRALADEWRQ